MKRYIKRPVVIEAIQLKPNTIKEVYEELNGKVTIDSNIAQRHWENFEDAIIKDGITINTPEGPVKLTMGNWLVKGHSQSLGVHYWPVEDGYFRENYIEENS